jgi:large subunit ribosomal protein L15
MRLHTLKPAPGSRHRRKRLGCGEGSGHGKTSGRGHKGQKARSGGSIRPGFEGGQMPLIRRLPKRGFNNGMHRKYFVPVNLYMLEKLFEDGATITPDDMKAQGLANGQFDGIKILARGEITKKFTISAHAASQSAISQVEAAGGTLTILG